MLNEIIEYREYTKREKTWKEGRLKYSGIVSNSLSGLERAFVIIARHILFDKEYDSIEARDKRIELAIEAVKAWCGFGESTTPAEVNSTVYPETLVNWMPDYIKNAFIVPRVDALKKTLEKISDDTESVKQLREIVKILPGDNDDLKKYSAAATTLKEWEISATKKYGKDDKTIKSIKVRTQKIVTSISAWSKFRSKKSSYQKALFTDRLPKEELSVNNNDSKAITYEKIIADALDMGPLERYYLVCEESALQAISDRSKHAQDLILKTTSAYLLEKKNCGTDQDYVFVNLTDIANWIVKNLSSKKLGLEEELLPKGLTSDSGTAEGTNSKKETKTQPLFRKKKIGGNALIMWVNPVWANKFMLVKEKDFAQWKKEHADERWAFFSDLGSEEYLQKNIEYKEEQQNV